MRRRAISLCALLLSITASLGRPGQLGAAPPPPCPSYDTFVFCERDYCPLNLSNYCLAQVGFPANCRVEQPFCYDVGFPPGCLGWDQEEYHYEITCPYLPEVP
jgi:hypothetical protein